MMMLALQQTKTFKKCLKKYKHKKAVLEELKQIMNLLVHEQPIPVKYRDHELKGNYQGIRELHLKPDDLLLYIKVQLVWGCYEKIKTTGEKQSGADARFSFW